jgi:NADH dehydrogenase/NADH:ubiquinone oxidoreductase subunit G
MTYQTIYINGKELAFKKGETILEVARRNHIESSHIKTPTLCHLRCPPPKNIHTGACRICVVEVETVNTLLPACAIQAVPGMVSHTDSAKVVEARKKIIQLMLSLGNHNCSMCGSEESHSHESQPT